MRIQLTWPCSAAACPTVTFVLPDIPAGALRPVLRRVLLHAEPVLGSAADAAGAGLLARLLLPLAVRSVCQALEGPLEGPGALQEGVS
ncbi:hypothetical protein CTZ27_10140 [Streptomyces griseocarneus]|nr:hypothetical protein CTZ27_10140 [Streptomyces griseocarneus]